MERLRLRAGMVLDAEAVLGARDVVVAGGRVVALEPFGTPAAAGEEVLGDGRSLLVPGLVNAHTHLAMTLLRGVGADEPLERWLERHVWPRERRMAPEDVYWGALLGAVEGLMGGTTAFVDMYFHADAVARAMRDAGVRASVAVGLAGEGEAFEAALERAGRTVADWSGAVGGRVEVRLGPHAPYTCPPASLRRTARAAEELGCGIHIHLAETEGEVERALAEHGRTPVQLAADAGLLDRPAQVAHVVWPRAEDLPLLARTGVAVAHCPTSNLQLGSGIAPALALADAGVRVAVGTDGPASAPGLDMLDGLRLAWLLAKGARRDPSRPTARDAFAWATRGGAQALGRDDVGRIAPGAAADLVLARLDRPGLWPPPDDPYAVVVQGLRGQDVRAVVVDGRVRVRDGRPVGVDLDALRREVMARARRLKGGAA